MKKLATIQAYRALAALLVVVYHASDACAFLGLGDYRRFSLCGSAGVYFFFALSGFILFRVHEPDFGHPGRTGIFFRNRFFRILPLYWGVTLMLLPFWFYLSDSGAIFRGGLPSLVKSLLLIPQARFPHLIPGWTLTHEVLFYFVFAGFLISRKVGGALMVAWIALIALAGAQGWSDDLPERYFWHPMNLLFPLGMLAAYIPRRLPALTGRAGTFMFLVGNALFLSGLLGVVGLEGVGEPRQVAVFGAAAFLILAGSTSAAIEAFFSRWTTLLYLGGASFSIYLIHYPAVSAAAKITRAAGLFTRVPSTVVFALLAAAGVTAGLLLYRFVERPLLAARAR